MPCSTRSLITDRFTTTTRASHSTPIFIICVSSRVTRLQDGGTYSGTLAYRDGTLRYGNYAPLPHNLDAKFDATRDALKVAPATLSVGPSQVELVATLRDYSNPAIQANYRANLDGEEFRRELKNPNIPAGMILLTGTAQYQNRPNTAVLNSLTLNGQMSSTTLLVNTSGYRGIVRDLSARYSLANGNAAVQDLHAKLLGGTFNGGLNIHDLAGRMQSQLDASLRDISVADLQSLLAASSLQEIRLIGTTNATVKASWNGSMQNLDATADASLRTQAIPREVSGGAPAPASIPLDALFHARYSGKSKQVSLTQSYIRLPQTSLNFNGTVSERSSLQIAMQSNDLHELEIIANAFRSSSSGRLRSSWSVWNGKFYGIIAREHYESELAGSAEARRIFVFARPHGDCCARMSRPIHLC